MISCCCHPSSSSLHPFNRIRDQEKRGEPRKGKKGIIIPKKEKRSFSSQRREEARWWKSWGRLSLSLSLKQNFLLFFHSISLPWFRFLFKFFFLFLPTDQFCSPFFWISTGVCFTQFSLTASFPFGSWKREKRREGKVSPFIIFLNWSLSLTIRTPWSWTLFVSSPATGSDPGSLLYKEDTWSLKTHDDDHVVYETDWALSGKEMKKRTLFPIWFLSVSCSLFPPSPSHSPSLHQSFQSSLEANWSSHSFYFVFYGFLLYLRRILFCLLSLFFFFTLLNGSPCTSSLRCHSHSLCLRLCLSLFLTNWSQDFYFPPPLFSSVLFFTGQK